MQWAGVVLRSCERCQSGVSTRPEPSVPVHFLAKLCGKRIFPSYGSTPWGGGGAERGRGERRDRGRSDKGEHDEKGATARWHEGCSENRRETAKRDRKRSFVWKRRTPKGGRRLAHHTPLLKSLCGGGVPFSHPSLGLSVFFLSFLGEEGERHGIGERGYLPQAPQSVRNLLLLIRVII